MQTFNHFIYPHIIKGMTKTEGDIFKELIEKSKYTQNEIAEKLGTSRVTVSKLTKRGRISEDWKLKICKVLGVSKDVFTGKEIEFTSTITQDERDALWQIINAQKELIKRLEGEGK